ncbi:DUF3108 domain-containing protein [Magnetococcales bacterium HHB-1]
MIQIKWFTLLILLLLCHPAWGQSVTQPPSKDQPTLNQSTTKNQPGPKSGEWLKFNIHWLGIPAGDAEFSFHRNKNHFKIRLKLRTVGIARMLHLVDDTLVSSGKIVDNRLWSQRYLKHQKGKKKRKTEHVFHRAEQKVTYTILSKPDDKRYFEKLPIKINDPLASFYAFRYRPYPWNEGDIFDLPMIGGRKRLDAKVRIGQQTRLYTPLGWFDVIPVYPVLKKSKLFHKDESLTIWVSMDHHRLPVRIDSDVKVGFVSADLIEYKDGAGNHVKIWDQEQE